jgi:putative endopeptidase
LKGFGFKLRINLVTFVEFNLKNEKMKLKTIGLMMVSTAVLTSVNAQEKQSKESHGINTSYMDRSVKPNDDFFRFVNGTWFDNTEIPADRTRWGSFDELRKNTDEDVKSILQEAIKSGKYASNTDQGKAISYYKTIMDTVTRNKNGITPLKPYLQKIDAVKNAADLQKLLAEMQREGGGLGFFGVGVSTDAKNSNRNVVYLGTGSLGLPDREYYVSDTPDNVEKREKYVAHVTKMLQFLGENEATAKANAQQILAFETSLATPMLDRVQRRDRRKTYNPYSIADLEKLAPSIKWGEYLKTVGFTKLDSIIVSQPNYITAIDEIFEKGNVSDWKNYMRWTLLNGSTGALSTEIETASWEFYSKTLQGALQERPRDEKALQGVNGSLGEAIGKLYVEKKFPPEAKAKAEAMVKNVFKAFENRINNLPWMTKATKQNAIAKIHKTNVKIGYPDKWKDYSKLTIKSPEEGGTYFDNRKNISKWRFQENIEKLNKPVDKEEWFMSPQTVNAYFNPSFNEIVFPAAILQPPFYDYKADEAVNYGGIGAVIGHEISHSFDDSGSRYDSDGNLKDWWTEEDLKQFTELGGALADQYSALEPLPGIFVDGKFTLGENIGDLGGVNAAYDGLQIYYAENGRPDLIDGFTPEQRFFISWATIWRTKSRDEYIKNQVKTDPHSPAQYRAYVPLQNVQSFYDAFEIKEGDGMYIAPENRVKIW